MISFLVVFFSFIAPGMGQIFLGNYKEGILWGIFFALGKSAILPLFLRIFRVEKLKTTLKIIYIFNWLYIALICCASISAFHGGKYLTDRNWLYAILFAVMITLVYKNTLNNFVFTSLCGRKDVFDLVKKQKNRAN